MSNKIELTEFLRHPATLATAVTGVLGGVFHIPLAKALFTVLLADIGTYFTALSVAAFTLIPELGFVPAGTEEAAKVVALIAGVLFVGKLLHQALSKAYDKLETKI